MLLGIVLGIAALARDGAALGRRGLPDHAGAGFRAARCLPADTIADQLLDTLRRMATAATGGFAERRSRLRLPTLSTTTEVQQVTSGDRCAVAARGSPIPSGRARRASAHDRAPPSLPVHVRGFLRGRRPADRGGRDGRRLILLVRRGDSSRRSAL